MRDPEQTGFILVVDDDDLHAMAMAQQIRVAGFRAEVALDAVSALALIDAERPDSILLDVHMPGVDGLEFCRYVKTTLGHLDIPTVMITGLSGPEARERSRLAGADAFLAKPIRPDDLLEEIGRRLNVERPATV